MGSWPMTGPPNPYIPRLFNLVVGALSWEGDEYSDYTVKHKVGCALFSCSVRCLPSEKDLTLDVKLFNTLRQELDFRHYLGFPIG